MAHPRLNYTDAEHATVAPRAIGTVDTDTLSGSSSATAQLDRGLYEIVCTAACHYLQGGSSVAATTGNYYLPANTVRRIAVEGPDDDAYVAFIAASGTYYVMPL